MQLEPEAVPLVTAGALRSLWTADRLDTRLRQGRVDLSHLRALAGVLVGIHVPAAEEPGRPGEETRARADAEAVRVFGPALAAAVGSLEAALRARAPAGREQQRVRHLHGALRLDRIHIDAAGRVQLGRPAPGAAGDALEDVSSLSFALVAQGRADLAEGLLAAYADLAHDYELYGRIAFYEGVAGLAAARRALESTAQGAPGRGEACAHAERLLELARARMEPGPRTASPPLLVAVGGVMASGKTTLAGAVAAAIRAPLVSGDRARAWLAEREPEEALSTAAVYGLVAERAEVVLASGRSVVVDACLPTHGVRTQLRGVAQRSGAGFLLIECRADRSLVRRRLLERARAPGPSREEWLQLLDRLLAEWEPVRQMPRGEHLVVPGGASLEQGVARVLQALAGQRRDPQRVRRIPRSRIAEISFQS